MQEYSMNVKVVYRYNISFSEEKKVKKKKITAIKMQNIGLKVKAYP